jgi:hypothetical protein
LLLRQDFNNFKSWRLILARKNAHNNRFASESENISKRNLNSQLSVALTKTELQFDQMDEITWNLSKYWKFFTIGVKFWERRNLTSVLLQETPSDPLNPDNFSSSN